jgi:tetratricopeptide (TPR) repeat protein
VAAAVLIFVTLLGGIAATLWQAQVAQAALRDAQRERAEAEAQTRRAETEQAKAEAQRARAEQALAAQALAEAQRSLAHGRSVEVHRTAKTVMVELQEEIKRLPGSMQAQGLVVKYMLEYLDGLANEASSDLSLQRELAAAYETVGDAQGNSSRGELGDLAGALRSYRRALSFRQSLARNANAHWRDRYYLATSHHKLGQALAANRQRAEAIACFRRALALVEDLSSARPQDRRFQRDRAQLHRDIGVQIRLNGDEAEALAQVKLAQEIFESLPAEGSISESSDADSTGRNSYELGILSREAGNPAEALRHFRQRLEKVAAVVAAKPDDATLRGAMGGAHMQIGKALLLMSKHGEAVPHYRQALTIFEWLSSQDPTNVRQRRNLSSAHRKLATALKESGERAEALTHFQQAVEVDETLAAQNPSYTPTLNLAANHEDVAGLAAEVGDVTNAMRHYQRALFWREKQVAREQSNPTEGVKLGETHSKLADALRRNGETGESLKHYRQALALGEEAVRLDPTNGETRWQLSRFLHRIANCLTSLNDTAGAFEHLHRALVIRESLAAESGASVFMRIEPTYIHIHLGELHAALAANETTPRAERITHWQAARAWYAKSLAIFLTVREQGLLPAKHAARPDEIAGEIAKCGAALRSFLH